MLFPPSLTIYLPSVCLTFALCLVLCCAGTVLCVALTTARIQLIFIVIGAKAKSSRPKLTNITKLRHKLRLSLDLRQLL